MKRKIQSEKYLRHRKFLMVVPILVLPFLAMIFYALGGGTGSDANAAPLPRQNGLNVQLPEAKLKDDLSLDKMSFYELAAADSQKRAAMLKDDPYALNEDHLDTSLVSRPSARNLFDFGGRRTQIETAFPGILQTGTEDANEQKVYNKLAALSKVMQQSDQSQVSQTGASRITEQRTSNTAEESRHEMRTRSSNEQSSVDPEVEQLNGMLDKIMDIQHPTRVADRLKQSSKDHATQIFPVLLSKTDNNVTVFHGSKAVGLKDTSEQLNDDGFFPLKEESSEPVIQNTIEAVIPEAVSLVAGSTVKVMINNDVYVSGELIPKGTFVYGTASLNEERLKIVIQNIRYKTALFPVKISAYDLDGMEGIFIPGAITRDVAKTSVEQMVQGVNISNLDPSISAQAASAGVDVAKSLLTKRAKLVRVFVKPGYKILLKSSDL